MMALPSVSKLAPAGNQDNLQVMMTSPCGLLDDQFYFSNMLRSFLPKNRSCKKYPGCDPVTSFAYWWCGGWRPGPEALIPWPWGLWLPPFPAITAPCIFPSTTSDAGNKIFLRARNKRHVQNRKLGSANANFRSHGRSAFSPIRPGSKDPNCQTDRGSNTGCGPNVHYVLRNLSAIFNGMGQSPAILKSSLPSCSNLQPDCGRFSALLGLELVVDYVSRDDVLATNQNNHNCAESSSQEAQFTTPVHYMDPELIE